MADPDTVEQFDAIVIGAGFAGMYMLHKLRHLGCSVRVYERGHGVGGTWYWNRYPGARCDSESMYYSYSFLPDLEQEWHWSERYPGQAEVLSYLETVADRLDLRRDIEFDTEVTSVYHDDAAGLWRIRTRDGREAVATYCITAVGCLSAANVPRFPGDDTFRGPTYHTGAWPHEGVDFSGRRVGVIGTGASGIQAIPVIAAQAAQLTVFQRTPNYTIPAQNHPLEDEFEKAWKADYREWWRKARDSMGGIPYPRGDRSVFDDTPAEQLAAFEAAWGSGGFRFMFGTYNDLVVTEDANAIVADFVRSKIDDIVHDPEVARMLKPTTYPLGTKRLPLDTDYYETFNRDNVTLVDIQATPIDAFTPAGIHAGGEDYQLDDIVYATGFDALTGPLFALNVRGVGGEALKEKWAEGPHTYLGLTTRGFPNLFTITGPGSPSVLTNMPVAIEQHVEWIADCIAHMRDEGIRSIEATAEAEDAWTSHVNAVAARTLYPKAASWYMGANIAGKPRVFLPYVGGLANYRQKCDQVAANGYEGFELA